jgi:hypothetical protein
MVDFDCMIIMHIKIKTRIAGHKHNVTIDSYPTHNLSNIKCCMPFLSNHYKKIFLFMTKYLMMGTVFVI